MLGYDVDFGHMETVQLISAPKYAEKQVCIKYRYSLQPSVTCLCTVTLGLMIGINQVGYIVTSCLLNENHDFLRLVINTVRNDIIGRNETFQCLALTMVHQLQISVEIPFQAR